MERQNSTVEMAHRDGASTAGTAQQQRRKAVAIGRCQARTTHSSQSLLMLFHGRRATDHCILQHLCRRFECSVVHLLDCREEGFRMSKFNLRSRKVRECTKIGRKATGDGTLKYAATRDAADETKSSTSHAGCASDAFEIDCGFLTVLDNVAVCSS